MDHDACKVIYLNRRAKKEETWTSKSLAGQHRNTKGPQPDEVEQNVRSLLSVFSQVDVHKTSDPCLSKVDACCQDSNTSRSIILLVDVPPGEDSSSRLPRSDRASQSPASKRPAKKREDPYGMDFLQHLAHVIRKEHYGSRIIPVAILSGAQTTTSSKRTSVPDSSLHVPSQHGRDSLAPHIRYFEAGAVEVMTSPLSSERVLSLPAHVHRLDVERNRRRSSTYLAPLERRTSWVGTAEDRPYSQVKDKMVSELMDRIVNPDGVESLLDPTTLNLRPDRQANVASAFGSWSFSAHDYSDDELLWGVFLALKHTLELPGLEKWRLNDDDLLTFLMATQRVYNKTVIYHNFRHACDVLQASFYFLISIGAIPPYPNSSATLVSELSAIGSLISPYHAMVLLITAIGHDVGHPGVNNGFLVKAKAPLAQLYNDRSVLEAFHCAAYSQILRRYWKVAFEDEDVRRLMIKAILATDMGEHKNYMQQLTKLQGKCPQTIRELTLWAEEDQNEARELLLCVLIKCADICNVARKFQTAADWAKILINEFYEQGQIELQEDIPTSLAGGPPDPNSELHKAGSQIGFMDFICKPLFKTVASVLPSMKFAIDEIDTNKKIWDDIIKTEKVKSSNQVTSDPAGRDTHMSVDVADGKVGEAKR